MQTQPDAALPSEPALREVRYEHSSHFPGILKHCRSSLLVSTYQAGKLGAISEIGGALELGFYNFEQVMGVAAHPQKIAVGTRNQVWFLKGAHDLAPRIEPAGLHDACFLARNSLVTGSVHIHEMAWGGETLWSVNTLFSCLMTLHDDFSFVPRWKPKFISELAAEDRCHLNGLAMVNGKPRYVTAMATTNTAGGWRPTKSESGVIIDVESNEVVTSGMAMPHSPRWYGGRLWVLDSGRGRLVTVDLKNGQRETVADLPGYTRGLAFCGQFAFVGLSRIRETAVFGGVPIAQRKDELKCGVGVIDLVTGESVAALQFHSGVEEIFDIQVLSGISSPFFCGPIPTDDSAQAIWLVPPENVAAKIAEKTPAWLKVDPAIRFPDQPNFNATFSEVVSDDPRELVRRGLALHENGQIQESITSFQQALKLKPDYADAWNNLGNVLQDSGKRDEAIRCYRKAVECDSRFVHAWRHLGYLLREEGRDEEGLTTLQHAQELEPNEIIRFVIATSLPPIYQSQLDIARRREALLHNVAQLKQERFSIDVSTRSAPTMFYSAYQGENDRDLQSDLATIFRTPEVHLAGNRREHSGKRRIGLISRHFKNHTIGRLNLGLVRELPRDDFEVTVISVGRHEDVFAKHFADAADRHVSMPVNLAIVREQVASMGLDVLFFTDVGMDTLTYTLALSRLATVQCATWGHPVTTGSKSMDYFISSRTLETESAAEHYTEELILFDRVNSFYYRPDTPPPKTLDQFGLNPRRNIYLCFQNLFKIHPGFDSILAAILERDPNGEIVFMDGVQSHWTKLLRNRFSISLGANANRVQFIPGQSHPDFLALNAAATVSLDPIHFGGGNTTYEAFAMGLPVVTMPSPYLRGRISAALYRQMGMTDCIVQTPDEYANLAVRLGTDRELRHETSKRILEACPVLFEDRKVIDEYADFFRNVSGVS